MVAVLEDLPWLRLLADSYYVLSYGIAYALESESVVNTNKHNDDVQQMLYAVQQNNTTMMVSLGVKKIDDDTVVFQVRKKLWTHDAEWLKLFDLYDSKYCLFWTVNEIYSTFSMRDRAIMRRILWYPSFSQ